MSEPVPVGKVRFTRFGPEKPAPAPTIVSVATRPGDMEKATLLTKAKRLRMELTAWAKFGMPLASSAVRKARLAVCEACAYYDPKGNWGMGECKAPLCGCSRIKAALATSKCPKGYWPA